MKETGVYPYSSSVVKMSEQDLGDGISYVRSHLARRYPSPGNWKEKLVGAINYHVPNHACSKKDRPELVARLVVELQRQMPLMGGTSRPAFPKKVTRSYQEQAQAWLDTVEGKSWMSRMLAPAPRQEWPSVDDPQLTAQASTIYMPTISGYTGLADSSDSHTPRGAIDRRIPGYGTMAEKGLPSWEIAPNSAMAWSTRFVYGLGTVSFVGMLAIWLWYEVMIE